MNTILGNDGMSWGTLDECRIRDLSGATVAWVSRETRESEQDARARRVYDVFGEHIGWIMGDTVLDLTGHIGGVIRPDCVAEVGLIGSRYAHRDAARDRTAAPLFRMPHARPTSRGVWAEAPWEASVKLAG